MKPFAIRDSREGHRVVDRYDTYQDAIRASKFLNSIGTQFTYPYQLPSRYYIDDSPDDGLVVSGGGPGQMTVTITPDPPKE